MDRKSIAVVVTCVILLVAWIGYIQPKYWPNRPLPPSTNTVTSAQSPGGTNATNSDTAPITTASLPLEVNANIPEQLLVVSNDNARYTFSSYGGGLKLVELLKYPETTPSWRNRKAESAGVASLNSYTPSPTLTVLGGSNVLGDGVFNLTRTANGVRAEKTLPDGLVIVKEFSPTTNYLVNASVWLENRSTQSLSLPAQEWTVGTATPMKSVMLPTVCDSECSTCTSTVQSICRLTRSMEAWLPMVVLIVEPLRLNFLTVPSP